MIPLQNPPHCVHAHKAPANVLFYSSNVSHELRQSLNERVPLHASKRLLSEATHVSTTNCFANCSGSGVCRGHFCECPGGTIGSVCQPAARIRDASDLNSSELSVQLLELPAAVQYERAERFPALSLPHGRQGLGSGALLIKRAVYWSQGFFYSHLVRDAELVVHAGARVLVALDGGLDLGRAEALRLAGGGAGRAAGQFEWTILLSRASTDIPRARSEANAIRMHPYCPRPSKTAPRRYPPNPAFHPDRDVCLPPNDPVYSPSLDAFNGADWLGEGSGGSRGSSSFLLRRLADGSAKAHAGAPVPAASSGPGGEGPAAPAALFEPSLKATYDLFFVGKVGGFGPECNRSCTDTLEALVDAQTRGLRHCSVCYSYGMRQYLHRHFRDLPRVLIGGSLPRTAPRDAQSRSKFCLVAGGVGFDMRITSSVLHGCIPLWTNRFTFPPLFRVWRLERLMVAFSDDTPAERHRFVRLAQLPAFVRCYEPALPGLLANLQAAWPALLWGSGTAYEHTLLEIANVTGTRATPALRRILARHGARYVAEVTQLPLDAYDADAIPGLHRARALRAKLQRRAHDPLGEALERARACVAALPLRESNT